MIEHNNQIILADATATGSTLTRKKKGLFPLAFRCPSSTELHWVETFQVPGKSGGLGVLDGHCPLYCSLEDGVVRFKTEEGWKANFVPAGFLIIYPALSVDADVAVTYGAVGVIYSGRESKDVMSLEGEDVRRELAEASIAEVLAESLGDRLCAEKGLKRAKAKVYAFENAEAALTNFV
jgi:F0F1-type ATP synthase epsilon subunit